MINTFDGNGFLDAAGNGKGVPFCAAVALYFSLNRVLDRETVSWVCIVGAAPVAAAGFFQYNGLTLERFLWAWLKSEVIMAGKRVWKAENYYEEAMKREVKKH